MKSGASSRTNTQADEHRRSFLPKINDAQITTDGGQVFENPFFVPPDEEIFKWKDQEKQNKLIEKMNNQNRKVWEKGIKQTQGKMRALVNFDDIDDEDAEKDGKINIVEAAKSAIKNRVRHKEPMPSFIQKKREMFLFQMSINQKKEQIKEFEELAHLQEIGLQRAMELLEQDADVFKKFVETNKNETRQKIKIAEDETKKKQERISEMKQLQENLSTIMSKNIKQLEKLEKLYQYKVFLDDLAAKKDDEFKKHLENKQRFQSISSNTSNERFNWQIYNHNLPQGLLELLNQEDDEEELYFKNPEELQGIFSDLERMNLEIIKQTRDVEQDRDDMLHKFKKKEQELNERKKQLLQNKSEIEKLIQQKKKLIGTLDLVKSDKKTENALKSINNAVRYVYESSKIFTDTRTEQDPSSIDILKELEKKLESQLVQIKGFDAREVYAKYKERLGERRRLAQEAKEQKRREEEDAKREALQKRLEASRRVGRPIMAKSRLNQGKKEEIVDDEPDQDEIDRQKFFTVRFF